MTISGNIKNLFIIRRSLVIFVMRLIAIELVFGIFYLSIRYINSFLGISFSQFLLVESVIFMSIEIFLICYVILSWVSNYYVLKDKELIIVSGILVRKEQSISLSGAQSITYEMSIIGRILNYGNVHLYSPVLQKEVYLSGVSEPKSIAEEIERRVKKGDTKLGMIVRRN
ncbi:MAG: PH domain-containing protein [Patescibacteria group bacterium]|nr:PH domain-containing protein [Patescibacteria group bacterium]